MKKRIFIFCTVVCLLILGVFIFIICNGGIEMIGVEKTLKEAEVVNSNSNFGGIEYLQFSAISEERAKRFFNDELPEREWTEDKYVTGYYFYYPYNSSDRRMTKILIKGGDYHVFGIKVGDNIADAGEALLQRGYKETKPTLIIENITRKAFKKKGVRIQLETEAESYKISSISVFTKYFTGFHLGEVRY